MLCKTVEDDRGLNTKNAGMAVEAIRNDALQLLHILNDEVDDQIEMSRNEEDTTYLADRCCLSHELVHLVAIEFSHLHK